MYKEAQLVFKSYIPYDGLQKDMLFIMYMSKQPYIYKLEKIPYSEEEFIKMNGFPVLAYIIDEGNPNISNNEVIYAHPNQIGWFDEGEHSDELYDIEVKNMNKIISEYNGWVYIEVDDNGFPVLYDDKVTILYADIEDEYEIDEDADDEPEYDPEEKYWKDCQTWSERHSNTNNDEW